MLSVCMIVQDEEECLARALNSIHDYVDEIILVDGGSVDRTKEIASSYPKVKIFDIPFPGDFSVARNNAIELASGEWVLIVDADEYFEFYILRQLRHLVSTTEFDAYHFARLTFVDGNLSNIFANNDDRTYRLFRNYCRYSGKMHEQVQNIRNGVGLNMYIVHDKTSAWQQKDNERCWDMGQVPSYGWVKVQGKWVLVGTSDYQRPDIRFWAFDDPRSLLQDFSEDFFRVRHNDDMMNERVPIVSLNQLGFSQSERMFVDEIVKLPEPRTVLDLGCANGGFVFSLLQNRLVTEGYGVDISDNMVAMARSSATALQFRANFSRSAVENFHTETRYSIVVANDVLEHLFYIRPVLKKIVEFLSPGGLFCGSVPDLLECNSRNHFHYFTQASLCGLLREFFSEVRVERVDYYQQSQGMSEFHLVFICRRV